jgi:hypothetical protein
MQQRRSAGAFKIGMRSFAPYHDCLLQKGVWACLCACLLSVCNAEVDDRNAQFQTFRLIFNDKHIMYVDQLAWLLVDGALLRVPKRNPTPDTQSAFGRPKTHNV